MPRPSHWSGASSQVSFAETGQRADGTEPEQAVCQLGRAVTWPPPPIPAAVVCCRAVRWADGAVSGHADRVAAAVGHRDRARPRLGGHLVGSPTNATGHPRPAPCRSGRALPCRRPSNRPRSTGWSARVSAAASRSTGSTPPPSVTCAPTWSWPRTCARSARSPPGTSPRPWTSWAARPRSAPWTPAPWTRSWRACCRSARPPGSSRGPGRSSPACASGWPGPGRGRGAGAAPGVGPGVGRSPAQRRALGAGDAGGRRAEAVLAGPGAPSARVPWTQIQAAAPQVVVFLPCGYGPASSRRGGETDVATAARAGRGRGALAVDASAFLSRPGPRLVDGVELLAAALHPGWLPPPPEGTAVRLGPGPHQ